MTTVVRYTDAECLDQLEALRSRLQSIQKVLHDPYLLNRRKVANLLVPPLLESVEAFGRMLDQQR